MRTMHLEPAVANACGDHLEDAGEQVGRVGRDFGATDALGARDGAIASAEAAGACRKAWSDRITQQGTESSLLGGILHDAVQAYLDADHRSAEDMRGHSRNMAI